MLYKIWIFQILRYSAACLQKRFCSCEKMSWWLTLILGGSDVSFVNIFKANEYWINNLSAYNSESLCKMFVRKQEILAKQIPVFWFNSLMPVAWNKNWERESSRINILFHELILSASASLNSISANLTWIKRRV